MIRTHRYTTGQVLDCSATPNDPVTCVQVDSIETGPKEWADPLTQTRRIIEVLHSKTPTK